MSTYPDNRKAVEGYEGLYEITRAGDVISLARSIPSRWGTTYEVQETVLKPIVHKEHGYCLVGLAKNGKTRQYRVHILVAKAFIENPEGKPTVNHVDGDKKNNAVFNLAWATHKEQSEHAVATGLYPAGDRNGSTKITQSMLPKLRERIMSGELIQYVAGDVGVSRNTITRALTRAYGSEWDVPLSEKRSRAASVRWRVT